MTEAEPSTHGTIYGAEPGLRFATVLDGRGGARALGWTELEEWTPADGVLWLHLERDHPTAQDWLHRRSGIDPLLVAALIDEETRPRVETAGDALLMVLRGIASTPTDESSDLGVGVDFVPVHLWVDAGRLISLRDRDHFLVALRDLRRMLTDGRGPRTVGALLIGLADKIGRDVDPVIDRLDDEVDHIEDRLIDGHPSEGASRLGPLRRRVLLLRRYLAPQRDALRRLQEEEPSWLGPRDQVLLREVMDKVQRQVEQLDALRDRLTILHEEMTSLTSEQIARNSNRLAAVAALMLPPSTVAALFGMNLQGIPGAHYPFGFVVVVAALLALSAGIGLLLRRLHWI